MTERDDDSAAENDAEQLLLRLALRLLWARWNEDQRCAAEARDGEAK